MCREERIIKLEDGELYGPKVTEDIKENDFFIECYRKAAKQTLEIISNTDGKSYKIKNIIAFLGNRGQGKTSVMKSFVNALSHKEKVLFDDKLKEYHFVTLDNIDPSTFEDSSNILDIILGQLLNRIQEKAENNYKLDVGTIIGQFSELYNQIRVIKNKSLLDSNYELYDGSLENLITISDVGNFKKNLGDLINNCLDILGGTHGKKILVISIDDIDIDLSYCYDTVDTVRKYLNLPKVLVVMAAKLEQLHEGIRMEHLSKIKSQSSIDSNRVYEDVYNMATKYLLKILPQNRRIHIPELINNINSLQYNIKIEIKIGENNEQIPIHPLFANLLYEKTGILVLNNDQVHSYLLNGNLRNMIDFYSCLHDMEKPKNGFDEDAFIYLENLEKFKDYFLNNWCTNNLSYTTARLIRKLYTNGSYYKNHDLIQMLIELEDNDEDAKKMIRNKLRRRGKKDLFYDLADVSYLLSKVENHVHMINVDDVNKFVYAIKMCYTIIMNQLRFVDNLNNSNGIKNKINEIINKKHVKNSTDSEQDKNKELLMIHRNLKNKYSNYQASCLMKFIGGRILIEDVLLKEKTFVEKQNQDSNAAQENTDNQISNMLNNKILNVVEEKLKVYVEQKKAYDDTFKNIILVLLLSTTSKDYVKDIYFYSPRNDSNPVYFDPLLFFVNCLNLEDTFLYLLNGLYPINNIEGIQNDNITDATEKSNDTTSKETLENSESIESLSYIQQLYTENVLNILKNSEKLEHVARSVICNFNLYDFLVDYLDMHLKIENGQFSLSVIYDIINKWLNRLNEDLKKQYKVNLSHSKYNEDIKYLTSSIDEVKKIVDDLKNIAISM